MGSCDVEDAGMLPPNRPESQTAEYGLHYHRTLVVITCDLERKLFLTPTRNFLLLEPIGLCRRCYTPVRPRRARRVVSEERRCPHEPHHALHARLR